MLSLCGMPSFKTQALQSPWKLYIAANFRPPIPHPSGTFKRGVTERGLFAFACQYIVSPRGRTGNRTVTQMRHPLFAEGRPNCARQPLASTLSALTSRRHRTAIPVATQISLPCCFVSFPSKNAVKMPPQSPNFLVNPLSSSGKCTESLWPGGVGGPKVAVTTELKTCGKSQPSKDSRDCRPQISWTLFLPEILHSNRSLK